MDDVDLGFALLDHINLPVSELSRSADFYRQILAVLDMKLLFEDPEAMGFGREIWDFGLVLERGSIPGTHVAFSAKSRQTIQTFHSSALQYGGIDNGAPGPRTEYGVNYFSAYILDFDGHNIEAVSRG